MTRKTHEKFVIGVDLGGTKILSAAVNAKGRILKSVTLPTEAKSGRDAVISKIKRSIDEIISDMGEGRLAGIGVGAPGPVVHSKGMILNPPNLPGWEKVPLRDILKKRYRTRVDLANDADAAAIGEAKFGSARGMSNFIYITVSTGIGGGIIINGKLYRGSAGGAGEIGHMVIKTDGPPCGCGGRGCFEAMASGTAIEKRAREALRSGRGSSMTDLAGGDIERVTALTVSSAAKLGDTVALEVIKESAFYLGIGLSNLMNIFSPDMIGLGGGVMNMGDMILKPAVDVARKNALSPAREKTRIARVRLGEKIGVLGAAALALEAAL